MSDVYASPPVISRRSLLRAAGLAATASILPAAVRAESGGGNSAGTFRIAHLTDIHVQPELRADEGFRKCLAAVHELRPKPELILTGGDLVMDVLAQGEGRAKTLFDLYTRICRDSDIPIRHCIGNHDVFGWGAPRKVSPDHAAYGKKMVQERLDLPRTTYSFEHKDWHVCMVDDIRPLKGEGYEGGIGAEDLAWLTADLNAAGERPKLLVAHIPIVSAAVFRGTNAEPERPVTVPHAMTCRNPGAVLTLLRDRKVNLVLTGHLHDNEVLRYEHTTHIGDGAVCGAWWKGTHRLSPEGFGVVDLRADGTFEHKYHTYGWKAAAE